MCLFVKADRLLDTDSTGTEWKGGVGSKGGFLQGRLRRNGPVGRDCAKRGSGGVHHRYVSRTSYLLARRVPTGVTFRYGASTLESRLAVGAAGTKTLLVGLACCCWRRLAAASTAMPGQAELGPCDGDWYSDSNRLRGVRRLYRKASNPAARSYRPFERGSISKG